MRLDALLDSGRRVYLVQSQTCAVLVRKPLCRNQHLVRGIARIERHCPCPHLVIQAVIVLSYRILHNRDGFLCLILRQIHRVRLVSDMCPHDYTTARLLVCVHARIEEFRAARIHEAGCAALQHLHDSKQGRAVFRLFVKLTLQSEHIRQVVRSQGVGKYAPRRVRVADVSVPVHHSRRNHHLTGVYNAVRRHCLQIARLANLGNAPVPNYNRAVPNNPAPGVHRQNEPRIVYSQSSFTIHIPTVPLNPVSCSSGSQTRRSLLHAPRCGVCKSASVAPYR